MRPFPNVAESRFPVSSSGGRAPLWSRRGLDLYYEQGDDYQARTLMDARLSFQPRFEAVERPAVAPTRCAVWYSSNLPQYDVLPDGQGIITLTGKGSDRPIELIVVQNFFERLRRLARPN